MPMQWSDRMKRTEMYDCTASGGVSDDDDHTGVKLLGDVTHMLQMRNTWQHGIMCIDTGMQIDVRGVTMASMIESLSWH